MRVKSLNLNLSCAGESPDLNLSCAGESLDLNFSCAGEKSQFKSHQLIFDQTIKSLFQDHDDDQ